MRCILAKHVDSPLEVSNYIAPSHSFSRITFPLLKGLHLDEFFDLLSHFVDLNEHAL